jgi:hypothetical protein
MKTVRKLKKYQKDGQVKKGLYEKDGIYTYTDIYNTDKGKRGYSASSPDIAAARKIAEGKAKRISADSIPVKDLKRKGGSIKTKTSSYGKVTGMAKKRR